MKRFNYTDALRENGRNNYNRALSTYLGLFIVFMIVYGQPTIQLVRFITSQSSVTQVNK